MTGQKEQLYVESISAWGILVSCIVNEIICTFQYILGIFEQSCHLGLRILQFFCPNSPPRLVTIILLLLKICTLVQFCVDFVYCVFFKSYKLIFYIRYRFYYPPRRTAKNCKPIFSVCSNSVTHYRQLESVKNNVSFILLLLLCFCYYFGTSMVGGEKVLPNC